VPTSPPSRAPFRLLRDGITDPFLHFALEEALLRGVDEGTSPETLRLRRVVPSVWIGVYQLAEEDVDLDYCREQKIPIVRRHNPGGAVYQDEGSFCFSLVFRHAKLFERLGIAEAAELYPVIAQAVIDTCGDYGVEARHSPTNDCTIGGRKVYGSAQVEWGDAFVHNGTFLVSTDCDTMEKVLKPSRLKFADKGFHNVRERVVTLSEAVGRAIEVDEVVQKLAGHLAGRLGIDVIAGGLQEAEELSARRLFEEKYSRPEWTFRPESLRTSVLSTKAASGIVTLAAEYAGGRLGRVEVRGDFLLYRDRDLRALLDVLEGQTVEGAQTRVERSGLPPDVREALTRLLRDLGSSA
jgi:lipoate---protein ligase